MANREKEYLEQNANSFGKDLGCITRMSVSEKSKEIHRWAAIYTRYKLTRSEWQAYV